MKAVDEIIEAIEGLNATQFMRFQKKLESVEKERWNAEQARISETNKAKGITDRVIDNLVLRRRRDAVIA